MAYNESMNTNQMTPIERDAILMINAYGLDVAVKVARNQTKMYATNPVEFEYRTRVYNTLVGMQTKKFTM